MNEIQMNRFGVAALSRVDATCHSKFIIDQMLNERSTLVEPLYISSKAQSDLIVLKGYHGGLVLYLCETFWQGKFVDEFLELFQTNRIMTRDFPESECHRSI